MGMVATCVEVSPSLMKELEGDSEKIHDLLESDEPSAQSVYLDKAWHGIHYLLAGEAWGGEGAAANAILGGAEFGEDVGYGPARYLAPAEVKETAAALKTLSVETLRARYIPEAMEAADIYPSIWTREGQEAFDYLMDHYKPLVAFYEVAAANHNGVVLLIS